MKHRYSRFSTSTQMIKPPQTPSPLPVWRCWYGSLADIAASLSNVCFTPESGHLSPNQLLRRRNDQNAQRLKYKLLPWFSFYIASQSPRGFKAIRLTYLCCLGRCVTGHLTPALQATDCMAKLAEAPLGLISERLHAASSVARRCIAPRREELVHSCCRVGRIRPAPRSQPLQLARHKGLELKYQAVPRLPLSSRASPDTPASCHQLMLCLRPKLPRSSTSELRRKRYRSNIET